MKILLPHTIENTTGEKITFLRITVKDGVEYLEGENEVQPNAGPPMHVHYQQDESFTVMAGKLGYQTWGQEKKYAGPGETVLFKAGVPHKFWNAGPDLLHCTGYISPAGNLDYFLTQLFQSSKENGGRPGIFDAAFLLNRYKSEFGLLEIPQVVQKTLFPGALLLGKLLGKYKKFKEAPPAM
ncbi:cupin domain-containing protein [Catalinimonas alkaloidigena]|nr:cupin domain-containing protein [Catalinimonas alkaloidigena]